jgi:cysteine-rich repeat protein
LVLFGARKHESRGSFSAIRAAADFGEGWHLGSVCPPMSCRLFTIALAVSASALTACAGSDFEDESGASSDESALSARGTSVPEESYTARGILRVVNELTEPQLRAFPLRVNATLASDLVRIRGATGFSSLAALDGVRQTGPAFFDRVIAYAKQNGYVGSCGDGKLEPGLESCDDGNKSGGDGCSATCTVETPPPVPLPPPPALELQEAVCGGLARIPLLGSLAFRTGAKLSYTRTCDVFGTCGQWVLTGEESVFLNDYSSCAGCGKDAQVDPAGGINVSRARVGDIVTSNGGSSRYRCETFENGYGSVNPTTGIGGGNLTLLTECNVGGGSGGPASTGPKRNVAIRLGSTCLALADVEPAKAAGVQTRSVLRLSW